MKNVFKKVLYCYKRMIHYHWFALGMKSLATALPNKIMPSLRSDADSTLRNKLMTNEHYLTDVDEVCHLRVKLFKDTWITTFLRGTD